MKVIKISAVWCSACLIMNKVWNNIIKKYDIETINLDYDFDIDEVLKYKVSNVLPVFIILDNNLTEVLRITGELTEKELINKLEEVGVINEKDI